VTQSSEYFGSDLVIDPRVNRRAAGALRRAHERHALVEYGKAWEPEERLFDVHTVSQLWLAFALVTGLWGYTFLAPAIFLARGFSAGQVLGIFLAPGLVLFVLATLAMGPASFRAALVIFGGAIVWPVTLPVLVVQRQRQWPDRYAERYHQRYVVPAADFDEAATVLWARAVETETVSNGPSGSDAPPDLAPRMWAIAELLARSSLPSELDRRVALLDEAARQVDLLGQ